MKAGGLAPSNLMQPAISLEIPVPRSLQFSQFSGCWTDFVYLYTYEFLLPLWKIVRSSVILLLPLFMEHEWVYRV